MAMSSGHHRERVGAYEVIKRLALGGMAEVLLARQLSLPGMSRLVVLKSVLAGHERERDFIEMFLDEARVMSHLKHPNIVQVFDAGLDEGLPYMVMEYIQGPTLGALIKASRSRKERVPLFAALSVILGLTEALAHVHDRCDSEGKWMKVVHRDLKPNNVLLSRDGIPKLIDFGIARAASKRHQTAAGQVKGTLGYIAPEQLMDKGIDQRADIFTLGILAYQLILGRYPFPASNEAARLRRLVNGDWLVPTEVDPNFSADLEMLLGRCLSADPQKRPPSMRWLSEALIAFCEEQQVHLWPRDLSAVLHEFCPISDEERTIEHAIESLNGPLDRIVGWQGGSEGNHADLKEEAPEQSEAEGISVRYDQDAEEEERGQEHRETMRSVRSWDEETVLDPGLQRRFEDQATAKTGEPEEWPEVQSSPEDSLSNPPQTWRRGQKKHYDLQQDDETKLHAREGEEYAIPEEEGERPRGELTLNSQQLAILFFFSTLIFALLYMRSR